MSKSQSAGERFSENFHEPTSIDNPREDGEYIDMANVVAMFPTTESIENFCEIDNYVEGDSYSLGRRIETDEISGEYTRAVYQFSHGEYQSHIAPRYIRRMMKFYDVESVDEVKFCCWEGASGGPVLFKTDEPIEDEPWILIAPLLDGAEFEAYDGVGQ